jgi:hypothetical protein
VKLIAGSNSPIKVIQGIVDSGAHVRAGLGVVRKELWQATPLPVSTPQLSKTYQYQQQFPRTSKYQFINMTKWPKTEKLPAVHHAIDKEQREKIRKEYEKLV